MLAAEAAGGGLLDEQAAANAAAAIIPEYFMVSFCSVHLPRCARLAIQYDSRGRAD